MNPETQKIQGAIDNWHDTHYKEDRGWASEHAKLAYEKLVAEKERESQNGASSSTDGLEVNEREIFSKVFGDRRGHSIGIGRKLKRPSGMPSSTTSTPSLHETIPEMIRAAQEASDQHHEEQNRKRYQDLISALMHVIPNAHLANFPPFESTPAP